MKKFYVIINVNNKPYGEVTVLAEKIAEIPAKLKKHFGACVEIMSVEIN